MANRFIHRFCCASGGILHMLRTQPHARFHLAATVAVVLLGAGSGLSLFQWMALVVAVAGVWIAESLNTAIELLADALHPDRHPLIGKAKDVAAGAVLLASLSAIAIGLMVFIPAWKEALPFFSK